MAFLALSYPELEANDFQWIQTYRAANDARFFKVVDPHFTLVFPVGDAISGHTFASEVKTRLAGVGRIDFELAVAVVNRDAFDNYWHEFLVPEKGFSAIVRLYYKLYSGLFAPHQRLDIDFIPHIGIGNDDDIGRAKRRVDEINRREIRIAGTIARVDVVEYRDDAVKTLEQFPLA
jgi:2'-5' RNA ligase